MNERIPGPLSAPHAQAGRHLRRGGEKPRRRAKKLYPRRTQFDLWESANDFVARANFRPNSNTSRTMNDERSYEAYAPLLLLAYWLGSRSIMMRLLKIDSTPKLARIYPSAVSMRSRLDPRRAGFIEPALPSAGGLPRSGSECIHEIKFDGFRMLARRELRQRRSDAERQRGSCVANATGYWGWAGRSGDRPCDSRAEGPAAVRNRATSVERGSRRCGICSRCGARSISRSSDRASRHAFRRRA